MDEETVEELLQDCVDALDENPSMFTPWEKEFLGNLRERVDWTHFSDYQLEKLEEILEQRVAI